MLALFSMSWPCSLRKVQRNRLRFWMKFCSSSFPLEYASLIGIQFRKRSSVSSVAWTSGAFWEFSYTGGRNGARENKLRCLAFTWVICPLEKSNTSSLSSLRMIMLFWQRLSLVRLAPTMSLMKVGQCFGHSCFRI
ncbi:hypothetical protein EYF80_029313 [Liparis tanakae]|uniref:Uncharacterized protein n=1 Tax=Liparis tanakae TaxID=230148 RepID=A0A4Z2H6G2_9TELE|nr:hypothetical protein EYF80_029313 [Liparis tanakae]